MQPVKAQPKSLPLLAGAAVLVLLALGVYWPSLHNGFIWDDNLLLTGNELVKLPEGLLYIWFSTVPVDYFPVTLTSFWVEWRLWGLSPMGYHLTNILLHAASALLLWRVLAQLRLPGAFLAAALFLVHPVNVESVAWVAERKNTLSLVFYLASLLCYLRSEEESKVQSPKPKVGSPTSRITHPASRFSPEVPRPSPLALRLLYWLSLLAFVCSLLSKTAGVMLPFVLLGMAWWRRERVGKTDLLRALPFFGVALGLGLVTVWFQYHRAIGTDVIHHRDAWGRLAGAGHMVWFYLWKAAWPINLVFVYPEWKIEPHAVLAWLPDVALAIAFAVLWYFRKGWGRAGLFGLGYFVVVLFPVLGFFNIYFQKYSFVADHWQYFALPAVVAGVAGVVRILESRVQSLKSPAPQPMGSGRILLSATLGGALLLALGVLTWRQQLAYKDEETLWRHTLEQDPECWMANNNLGTLLQARGEIDQAVSRFRQSIQTQPVQVEAYDNLGLLLFAQGKNDEAMAQFKLALAANPNVAMTHLNIGNVLVKRGQPQAAFAEFQTAARLRPDLAEAHNNLGCLWSQAGRPLQAAAAFREALRWRPQYPEAMKNLELTLNQPSQPFRETAITNR